MLCDRHAFYREWFRHQLIDEADIEIVAEVEQPEGALQTLVRVKPDIVLVEAQTRTIPGVELGRLLKDHLPELKIIVLAGSEEEVGLARLLAMKEGGADACLLTDALAGEIASTIRAVSKGRWVAARAIAEGLFEEMLNQLTAERSRKRVCGDCGHQWTDQSPLTDREGRILTLLARGYTNRAIANALSLSEGTIKNYVHGMLEKLHLGSRLEAAVYAAKEGLI
ncbi:MAG: response regulator transcription factor [Actinomycetota bacterium]|nr:response regulator transcription factor [Actinomycetota bacterium]